MKYLKKFNESIGDHHDENCNRLSDLLTEFEDKGSIEVEHIFARESKGIKSYMVQYKHMVDGDPDMFSIEEQESLQDDIGSKISKVGFRIVGSSSLDYGDNYITCMLYILKDVQVK